MKVKKYDICPFCGSSALVAFQGEFQECLSCLWDSKPKPRLRSLPGEPPATPPPPPPHFFDDSEGWWSNGVKILES